MKIITSGFCLILASSISFAAEPIDIGNRLELFIDNHLIEKTTGDVAQKMLKPEPKEVIIVTDSPWEGNTSGYYTLFQDGDLYRMIYRGWQHDEKMKAEHKEVTCYAESKDGIRWTKPNLGLFEWEGSKENNIVMLTPGTHNFTAFRDDNPSTPPESRYKAVGGGGGGLVPFESADCKHWKLIQKKPVITDGAFDSQNLPPLMIASHDDLQTLVQGKYIYNPPSDDTSEIDSLNSLGKKIGDLLQKPVIAKLTSQDSLISEDVIQP